MAYWLHWLVALLNWPACLIKTVYLATSLDTDIMSRSYWFLPWFLLTLCLEYNSGTPLNPDLCFAFAGTALKGSGSFHVREPRLKRSQVLCWQVTGGGLLLPAGAAWVLDQRSCSPACPGQEKAGMQGASVPSMPTKRQFIKVEPTTPVIWLHVTF